MQIRIERKNIRDLRPADYNPRKALKPNNHEYEKLKRSIEEFGYVDPVIWNEQTGNVVGGHQRLTVLEDLGHEEIDVSVINITLTEEKALNVALNKISGEWDIPLLQDLITDLQLLDIDIELTGYDLDEIDELLDDIPDTIALDRETSDVAGVTAPTLAIGKTKVPMTDEEQDILVRLHDQYVDENGTNFGFAGWLGGRK